jgi:hypothetical protein
MTATSPSPVTTSGTAEARRVREFGLGLGAGWHGRLLWSLARRVGRVGGLGVALEHAGVKMRQRLGTVEDEDELGGSV